MVCETPLTILACRLQASTIVREQVMHVCKDMDVCKVARRHSFLCRQLTACCKTSAQNQSDGIIQP